LIDGLIANLKTAGIWSGLDAFWMFAAHDSSSGLLNWVSTAHNCTSINNPTFTTDRGFNGDGAASYLNTNYNPATQAVNFKQNDAGGGVYMNAGSPSNTKCSIGITAISNGGAITIFPETASGTISANLTCLSASIESIDTLLGLTCLSRTVSTSFNIYKNGGFLSNEVKTSNALTSGDIGILARNFVEIFYDSFSDQTISFAFIGRALTADEQATLFTIVETYLDAIGAGVVP